jgi:hypothetical protein
LGGNAMATSSITKRFVIRDEKTCLALAKALKASKKMLEKKPRNLTSDNSYEEGKKRLSNYLLNYQS